MIPAIAAGFAEGIIDAVPALCVANRVIRADVEACAAVLAKGLDKTHLRLYRKAFGIRAPLAGQRTALEKNHGANPRSVMN